MSDVRIPAPPPTIAEAFAAMPLEAPDRSAWPQLAARIDAAQKPARAAPGGGCRGGPRAPATRCAAATTAAGRGEWCQTSAVASWSTLSSSRNLRVPRSNCVLEKLVVRPIRPAISSCV